MTDRAGGAWDIKDLVAALSRDAPALARHLLPNGKRAGVEWRCGSLSGDPGQSLAVHVGNQKPGFFADFSTDQHGDILDLITVVACGGDKKAAITWARHWLGIDKGAPPPQQTRAQVEKINRDRDAEATRKTAYAFTLWSSAQPSIMGTPAESYLLGRNIDLRRLGKQPASLRFAPALMHPITKHKHPALLAAITAPPEQGGFAALHRTYLAPVSGGGYGKLTAVTAKLSLGRVRGGCIHLWRGRRRGALGKLLPAPRFAEAPAKSSLVITEGLEDGLTVALACPMRAVAVAVSLSNLASVVLPAGYCEIVIAADNDVDNPRAQALLEKAAARWTREGRSVRIARAPAGAKDFNDLLMGAGA